MISENWYKGSRSGRRQRSSHYRDHVRRRSRRPATAAVSWFRKAADQGNAAAQVWLGVMYASGHGVLQDYAAAVSWYLKAADQGNAGVQFNLGTMYDEGHGVPQDYVHAYMWFRFATGGNKNAPGVGDSVASKMTPAQIAEAQKLAREWKPKPVH